MGSGAKQTKGCRRRECHSRMGLQPDERLKKWFYPQNLGINLSIRFFSLSQQRQHPHVCGCWRCQGLRLRLDSDSPLWVGVKRQPKMTLRLGSPNVSHQQQLVFLKTISNQDWHSWVEIIYPQKEKKSESSVISAGNWYIVRLEGNEKCLGIITMLQADDAW